MKVVLDTNVLISGIFWSGPPYKILSMGGSAAEVIGFPGNSRRIPAGGERTFLSIPANRSIPLVGFDKAELRGNQPHQTTGTDLLRPGRR